METFGQIFSFVVGMIIGAQLGFKNFIYVWFAIGVIYAIIIWPLALVKIIENDGMLYEYARKGFIDTLVLAFSILIIWFVSLKFGLALFKVLGIMDLPEHLDRSIGAIVGASVFYVLFSYYFH